jgi:hypothetical protein
MREAVMPSELLLLHLFLWSFSTSISNVHNIPSSTVSSTVPSTLSATVSATLPIGFPKNIVVQPELRETVARLWAGSPTFRAQCLKIGERSLYRVAVVIEPKISLNRNCRAQCVLRVYSTGYVMARVMVPKNHELPELIPHELEHIVEHIDGVDVTRNVRKYGAGAFDAGRGLIETVRAIHAGRQARDELDAGTRAVALLTRR